MSTKDVNKLFWASIKAMSHGAIFLATCNAILLLRDVNVANTRLHYILLMCSPHIKQSSLINNSYISVELHCKLQEKFPRVTGRLVRKDFQGGKNFVDGGRLPMYRGNIF
jgi:hypothetical protein